MTLGKTLRAAYVVGRRDFVATVFSKTFLFFLLGPLFPILMGLMFGGLGQRAEKNAPAATVAVIATAQDYQLLDQARTRFMPFGQDRPLITLVRQAPEANVDAQLKQLLESREGKYLGVFYGGLADPHFTGDVEQDGRTVRQMSMFVDEAQRMQRGLPTAGKPLSVTLTDESGGSLAFARSLTARIGQFLLFFLTVFLAGMLLSQLIEEKSNKVIEVLAASVPIDAVFITLGVVYYTLNYLLIGATFLGIGAQASTVREVQTLSMPVTMAQMVLFGLAQLAIGQPDSGEALAAALFPLSSPFAMIARAAEVETLWPHLLAIVWQILWVVLIVRLSARLFRRAVLKSGPAFRWPWQRRATA